MFKIMFSFFVAIGCLHADPIQLEMEMIPFEHVSAIVTDIEGTTTSISFVHETLFPYAKKNVGTYLFAHWNEANIQQIVQDIKEAAKIAEANLEQIASTLLSWMEQDKKITPLKTLQGYMWEEGYTRGDFKGHLYEDAYLQMKGWKDRGLPLYVYSSGSVRAQQLLFSHSTYGDITPFFSGYFDTKVGGKKELSSYALIAQKIGIPSEEILFLSDSLDELNAARAAGMQTLFLCRDGALPEDCGHSFAFTFDQIEFH